MVDDYPKFHLAQVHKLSEGEKNHKKGGLNCVFLKLFFSYVQELFLGSESEEVQSLSEFRVLCSG